MNVYTIYIGDDEVTYSRFKEYLDGTLAYAVNFEEAVDLIADNCGDKSLMVFYEKRESFEIESHAIELFKSKFPKVYMVLVYDNINKGELLQYHKFGINDTVHKNVTKIRLRHGVEFVEKNQEIILSSHTNQVPLEIYKPPVWKRSFDIIVSVITIIILFPFLLLLAALIKIESKGPVIYVSKRVGSNYKVFDFYKFRSMYIDADKRLKEFINLNQYKDFEDFADFDYENSNKIPFFDKFMSDIYVSDQEIVPESVYLREKKIRQKNNFVKYVNDPRITKVGRFLRKFSLDELPQLINILKGDMSFVGNRPLPLYEAEQLTTDEYIDRFFAPAGLTGIWQVEKRGISGSLSPEERKQLDIYYAHNYNFWMDIKILFKTLTAFIQKENV